MKVLLTITDLTSDDLVELLRLAESYCYEPNSNPSLLNNALVALYFTKPSTRTRVSTESAVALLGGQSTMLTTAELQLGRGEIIEDTARVVSSYAAAIVIRTFSDQDLARFASAATVPVINALTDKHHPLQSIADLLTLRQFFTDLPERRIAYVGAATNLMISFAQATALLGIDISLACPREFPRADLNWIPLKV